MHNSSSNSLLARRLPPCILQPWQGPALKALQRLAALGPLSASGRPKPPGRKGHAEAVFACPYADSLQVCQQWHTAGEREPAHLPLMASGKLGAPQASQVGALGPGLALDGGLGGWAGGARSLGIADAAWHLWATFAARPPAKIRMVPSICLWRLSTPPQVTACGVLSADQGVGGHPVLLSLSASKAV